MSVKLSLADIAILHKVSKHTAKQMVKEYITKEEKQRADNKASNCKIWVDPTYILQDDNHAFSHFQMANKINELEDRLNVQYELIKHLGHVLGVEE